VKRSILVLGGTTFFGKAIVEELLKAGNHVTIFSRGVQKPSFWDRVEHVHGDRKNPDDFQQKLKGKTFDGVIDNIAFTAEEVNAALTAFAGRVGRYVLTSSASAYYTGTLTMPLLESDVDLEFKAPKGEENTPFWSYTLGKIGAERALHEQDRVSYTIIRPPMVLGPEDHTLRGYFYFQRLMDGKPLIVTNGGVQSFRLVYSRDLARGYLKALESGRAVGQTYNLAQSEVITLRDLLEEAAKALDKELQIVNVPADVLSTGGLQYPEPYALMTNFIPDISKAQREIGYTATPFATWLAGTVRWYRDSFRGKDSVGYEKREKEIEFVQRYRQVLSMIASQ
jgi:nucleoside-diphosphate-sugar epimerase